jgi:hypothetical protein
MTKKYITLSEYFQNPIEKSYCQKIESLLNVTAIISFVEKKNDEGISTIITIRGEYNV